MVVPPAMVTPEPRTETLPPVPLPVELIITPSDGCAEESELPVMLRVLILLREVAPVIAPVMSRVVTPEIGPALVIPSPPLLMPLVLVAPLTLNPVKVPTEVKLEAVTFEASVAPVTLPAATEPADVAYPALSAVVALPLTLP